MPTILELLRGVLTVEDQQQRFAADPYNYLATNGFGELSGDEMVAAIRTVRPSTPPDVQAALAVYESGEENAIPPTQSEAGEHPLDAAVRQLWYAASLTPIAKARQAPPETDAAEAAQPAEAAEQANWSEDPEQTEPLWADNPSQPAATAPEPPVEEQPMEHAASGRAGVDPYSAFGEELASIIRYASQQMEVVLQRAEAQADSIIKQAEAEGDTIRKQGDEEAVSMRQAANDEASAIRAAAEVDAQNLRQNATQEADAILQAAKSAREEARTFKQSSRDEANAILQNARSTQEDAQRQAADLIKTSEREASAMLAEARARRDEIREAERELRNRLAGVENVFRNLQETSVVPDDPDEAAPA